MQNKENENNPKLIGLLHIVAWDLVAAEFSLGYGVSLCRYKDSYIEKLVNHLAETSYLDEGEPLRYETAIVQDIATVHYEDYDYLGRDIDLICSLMGIVYTGAPNLTNIIFAKDDKNGFIVEWTTDVRRRQNEFLFNTMDDRGIDIKISQETAEMIKRFWGNLKIDIPVKFDRIENALRFYTQAWKSNTEEEALLNLTVVLETLFSPHSQAELSHQIAMNISRLLRKAVEDRKETYRLVKLIYAERSKITHGDSPSDWHDFEKYLWEAYSLCAETLRFILIDKKLTTIFRDNDLRRKYLDHLQFK
jgi:hypothetical protein